MQLVAALYLGNKFIGYFGHLYPGRGIEVIQGLAEKYPQHAFLVYGGNDKEIALFTNYNLFENFFFYGLP